MDMNKHTIDDGVRMVGQLLLHHPTTGFFAKRKDGSHCFTMDREASCFCFLGAINITKVKLNLLKLDPHSLTDKCVEVSGCKAGARQWDRATDEQRRLFAQRMADHKS